VDEAGPFAGDLFRRTFGHPAPTIPTHYVAFQRCTDGRLAAVGYYHVSFCGVYALVGGICVEPALRRRGIGDMLVHASFRDRGDATAYFAYVGDPKRSMRLGYVPTGSPNLMVYWWKAVSAEEQARLIAEVAAIGPF
jgi:hypothetical protein